MQSVPSTGRMRFSWSAGSARVSQDQDVVPFVDRTTLYVCVTCRLEGEPALPPEGRAGRRLLDALRHDVGGDPSIDLVPVECLSVCKRPCTVSLAAPGKWTYVYGDLPPDAAAPVILEAARLYARTSDGLIPWKQRSEAIKKAVVARIPPPPQPSSKEHSL